MKKIIIILLSLVLVFSIVGCGNNSKTEEVANSDLETSTVDSNEDNLDQDVNQEENLDNEIVKDERESEEVKDEEPEKDSDEGEGLLQIAKQTPDVLLYSDLPLYPDAELVSGDGYTLIYVTSDSSKDVYEFYIDYPELTSEMFEENIYYHLITPIGELFLDFDYGWKEEEWTAWQKEKDDWVEELGGVALLSLYITDKESRDSIDSSAWENVPTDKTVIEFSYAF